MSIEREIARYEDDVQETWDAGKPPMTSARAQEIVSAINDRCFFKMELVEKVGSLESVTLTEMLEAKGVIESGNCSGAWGKGVFRMIPDDRLIAAAYTLEHYRPDSDAICIIPHRSFDADLKAVAVIGLRRDECKTDDD